MRRWALIHLDELGCLSFLSDFRNVLVPDAVWTEVDRHRPTALRRRTVRLQRIKVDLEKDDRLPQLGSTFLLAAGELEALRLMADFPAAILLTDDAAARLVADTLGYSVHGTIGIIVRGLQRGQRTKRQILNLLRSVRRKSSLHISETLLNSVIKQIQDYGTEGPVK